MNSSPDFMTDLNPWIGRTEEASDRIDPWTMNALSATLDWDYPPFIDGMAVPPVWHWVLCRNILSAHQLGRDGHPKKGDFLPPVSLPRRMWAGGQLEFFAPLPIGAGIRRVSTIDKIESKNGRTGALVFVTVRHEIFHGDILAVREMQDLVYRQDPDPKQSPPPLPQAPTAAKWDRVVETNSTLLFRYSALTFNGHRIHYDVDYARQVEGYDGLVVHGPLLATWLAGFACQLDHRPLLRFDFRGRSPAICHTSLTLCANPVDDNILDLWVKTPEGVWITQARAFF